MEYDYEPLATEDDRRREWFVDNLASILLQHTPLPLELAYCVVQHALSGSSLCRYALESTPTALFGVQDRCCVRASTKIWARYVDVQGIEYISSLTDHCSSQSAERHKLIFDSDLEQPVNVVYVGKDHLGIRRLVFDSVGHTPNVEIAPGVWWETLQIPDADSNISWDTDVGLSNLLWQI